MQKPLKKPEIVAPAGNLKKLKIAINYGADAVYAGLSSFSLRARSAKQFDAASFAEGIAYAHARGRKVYATVNGFHTSAQLPGLRRHLAQLGELGPDALIIASLGAMKIAREVVPQIPIHVSTQANILNYADAQIYAEMGARRVVLARELGLADAEAIAAAAPVQIEAFVHGSMCFAYSGRCLISALQSGRRSNMGACANDCRFSYELYAKSPENGALFRVQEDERGTHIFNSKDLCLAAHTERIMQSGAIDAFKIEGRTKSEYYVACCVRAYRMAIDDAAAGRFAPERYERELATLKSRGFTDGYLIKRPYERTDTQNHLTSIGEGSMSVHALSEDGCNAYSKGLLEPGREYEIVAPLGASVAPCDNEIGSVQVGENGAMTLRFKQLLSPSGKAFAQLHSGNETPAKLPCALPEFSFLRA